MLPRFRDPVPLKRFHSELHLNDEALFDESSQHAWKMWTL